MRVVSKCSSLLEAPRQRHGLDRNVDRPEDERTRARFGLEVFPFPYLQISGFYLMRDDIPENLQLALPQRDEVFIELHLMF